MVPKSAVYGGLVVGLDGVKGFFLAVVHDVAVNIVDHVWGSVVGMFRAIITETA